MGMAAPRPGPSWSRRFPWFAVAVALGAACAGGPEPTAAGDPFRDRKFPALTKEQLRSGQLPEGYRLGDPAPAPDPQRGGKRPWRWSQDPNPETFGVKACSDGPRIDYVQWIWPQNRPPAMDLLREAGIELGPLVAIGRARTRDWGRLSQGHAQDERWDVFVHATNRPELFVQLQAHDRALDSLVWCRSREVLLADDERVSIETSIAALESAVAAGNWDEARRQCRRFESAGDASFAARIATSRAAVQAHDDAHDAPLLAELERLQRDHDAAWANTTDVDARVRRWASDQSRADALAGKLLGNRTDVPKGLRAHWAALVQQQLAAAGEGTPQTARGWFWRWAKQPWRSPDAVVTAWVRTAELDAPTISYHVGVGHRLAFGQGSDALLPFTAEADQVARRLLAAQLRELRAQEQRQQRALRVAWLDEVMLRDLETLVVPPETPFPYVDGGEFVQMWNAMLGYERAAGAGPVERARQLRSLIAAELPLQQRRAERTRIVSRAQQQFFQARLQDCAGELRSAAAAAATAGLHATAAVLELQAASALDQVPAALQGLGGVPGARPFPALQQALPVLAAVLPAIDPDTAQCHRLCELLAEGDTLQWPLVRHLAVRVAPGDVVHARAAHGLPGQHAHLVRDGDGGAVLCEREQPSDPTVDDRFWQDYSGWSDETRREGEWVRNEANWLGPEKQWLDQEKAELERLLAVADRERERLDANFHAIERDRASIDAGSRAQVDAFNQRVLEQERKRKAFNAEAEAWRVRSAAHKERTATFNRRVDEYNRRLAALNERRMREGAKGQQQLDALLWPALRSAIANNLQRWEVDLRQKLPGGPALEHEVRMGRWLFGAEANGPELWGDPTGPGLCRLQADAALRLGPRQSSNAGYAAKVAEWCYWAERGGFADREATLRPHVDEFIAHRDVEVLRTALHAETRLPAQERKRLLDYLAERRTAYFSAKK